MTADSDTAPADGETRSDATARGRLRPAMFQDHDEPAFPWWLPLPGIGLALLWAAYQGVAAAGPAVSEIAARLLWPGLPIFLAITITAYFGCRLDLD